VSLRDQNLVTELDIPLARVAEAMVKSRQTVTRGVSGSEDYFKVNDLAKALSFWRNSNTELYSRAREAICKIYPDVCEAVKAAADAGNHPLFSLDVVGEYWLICGDFVGFRSNLPSCAKQIELLCQRDDNQISFFVNEHDERSAIRWASQLGERAQVIRCTTVALGMMPTTLLRIDDADTMDLFGVSDTGFTPLARTEAARMRLVMQDGIQKDKR
jgi:hypothetical protein